MEINVSFTSRKAWGFNKFTLSLLFQYFDLAADVLAENSHLTFKFLTPVSKVSYSILYIYSNDFIL